jgi:hypothetical protein
MSETIVYRFFASKDERISVELEFDKRTYQMRIPQSANLPPWAKLSFNRCPNCTLPDTDVYCPAAVSLAQFLPKFDTRASYEKAVVEVETPNRTVVANTTFQHGMAALIGLTMATSGCPHTRFLRPMARAHLPFATEEETVFRALAFHLLAQYVASGDGGPIAISLSQLKENYTQLSIVNATVAERIRSAINRDAAVNAIIILECFALIAPENVDSGFEDIKELFVLEDEVQPKR